MDKVVIDDANTMEDESQEVPDAQFESPFREEEDYVVEDQFWEVEVIDDWQERMKQLKTPE